MPKAILMKVCKTRKYHIKHIFYKAQKQGLFKYSEFYKIHFCHSVNKIKRRANFIKFKHEFYKILIS